MQYFLLPSAKYQTASLAHRKKQIKYMKAKGAIFDSQFCMNNEQETNILGGCFYIIR